MNVCVIRNAEAESNSDIIRSMDAFNYLNINLVLLTRTRDTKLSANKVINKKVKYMGNLVDNYEIQINSRMDQGIKNLLKLFKYQIEVVLWLLKNKKKYDVIHSYDLDTGLPTLIVSKIISKPYVYHISGVSI